MPRRSTLVFGDDGTPASDVAWLWINNQRWSGWRLESVCAHPQEAGPPLPHEQTRLHRWTPPCPRQLFGEAEFAEFVQLTADADPRLVLSRRSELLVIGPRGPGLLKSLHLGSTATWLLAHPPAPLVIVRHGHTVRSVVLCVDGSIHARRVTEVLAELPWVDTLHVSILAVDDHRFDAEAASSAAAERLRAVAADVDVSIVGGKPTRVIIERLERATPDLVALGTKGLTGIHRLRVGSTAGAIAAAAACSALVACGDEEPDDETSPWADGL